MKRTEIHTRTYEGVGLYSLFGRVSIARTVVHIVGTDCSLEHPARASSFRIPYIRPAHSYAYQVAVEPSFACCTLSEGEIDGLAAFDLAPSNAEVTGGMLMGDVPRATDIPPYHQPHQQHRGRAARSETSTATGEADGPNTASPRVPRRKATSILSTTMALLGETTNHQLHAGAQRGAALRGANVVQEEEGSFYFDLGRNMVQNSFELDIEVVAGTT